MVLSAMAQDLYILLAKKSVFGNLLNVLNLIQIGPQIVFSPVIFYFWTSKQTEEIYFGGPT